MPKVKIVTPLVIGTTTVVAGLTAVMMVLEPEDLWAWLVVMFFLPTAIFGLLFLTRRASHREHASKIGGGLRAALVGAGVLLITALGSSVTDALGLTGSEGSFFGEPIMLVLVPTIAMFVDVLGARLEHVAAKDSSSD